MWAELTDAFGLGSAPQRDHAEVLMREAASEFLDMTDDDAQLDTWAALDAWAARWEQRIASDPELGS
jgi:hypothetical protein